jgi:outer membrane protein assembly factor BamB
VVPRVGAVYYFAVRTGDLMAWTPLRQKWGVTAPITISDTVYFVEAERLYAVNLMGLPKWSLDLHGEGRVCGAPAGSPDAIYLSTDSQLLIFAAMNRYDVLAGVLPGEIFRLPAEGCNFLRRLRLLPI